MKARDFDEGDADSIADTIRDMPETCALDVADRGGATAGEIGELIGIWRQDVEFIASRAQRRIRDGGHEFEEREHPEDFYIRYMNTGADELAEIAAELRARTRSKR